MKMFIAAAALICAGQACADQLNLKCTLTDGKDGTQSESWIVIDPAANYMRVDGVARPLNVTNERYASSQESGPFIRMTSIDRNTGEISVSSLFQGKIVLPKKGSCEKAAPPPPAKF